jgi:hypothetical protein
MAKRSKKVPTRGEQRAADAKAVKRLKSRTARDAASAHAAGHIDTTENVIGTAPRVK